MRGSEADARATKTGFTSRYNTPEAATSFLRNVAQVSEDIVGNVTQAPKVEVRAPLHMHGNWPSPHPRHLTHTHPPPSLAPPDPPFPPPSHPTLTPPFPHAAQSASGSSMSCTISPQQVCCKGKCLDTPVVIGIAVGASLGLICICAIIIAALCCRKKEPKASGGSGNHV